MSGSWTDKIGGESRWFKASQLEKEGRLEEALELYLKEAREQEGRSLAFSALSMLSAAKCAVKLGKREDAERYFREAGQLYERYAETIVGLSPNSSAWAYRMASRCYDWAGDRKSADKALKKAESLSEKIGEKGERYLPIFKQYYPEKSGEKREG